MCKPHYYCRNIHCKEWDTIFHARSAVELIHKKIAREFTPWAITQGLADNWVKDVKLIGNYLKVQEKAQQMKPKKYCNSPSVRELQNALLAIEFPSSVVAIICHFAKPIHIVEEIDWFEVASTPMEFVYSGGMFYMKSAGDLCFADPVNGHGYASAYPPGWTPFCAATWMMEHSKAIEVGEEHFSHYHVGYFKVDGYWNPKTRKCNESNMIPIRDGRTFPAVYFSRGRLFGFVAFPLWSKHHQIPGTKIVTKFDAPQMVLEQNLLDFDLRNGRVHMVFMRGPVLLDVLRNPYYSPDAKLQAQQMFEWVKVHLCKAFETHAKQALLRTENIWGVEYHKKLESHRKLQRAASSTNSAKRERV